MKRGSREIAFHADGRKRGACSCHTALIVVTEAAVKAVHFSPVAAGVQQEAVFEEVRPGVRSAVEVRSGDEPRR